MKRLAIMVVFALMIFSCDKSNVQSKAVEDYSTYEVREARFCKVQGLRVYNDDVGFSFIMPKGSLYNFGDGVVLDNYYVEVDVIPPEDFPDGVEEFESIKTALKEKKYPNIPFGNPSGTIEYKKIQGTNVAIDMYRGFDIYDGEIGKRLVFERNNRIILIYFTYFFEGPKPGDFSGPDRDVREEDLKNISVLMREIYLSYRQKIIKQKKEFGLGPYDSFYYYLEQDFRKGKLKNVLPEEVQKLIIDFDTIINSLELK